MAHQRPLGHGQSPDGRRQVMVDTAHDRLYGRIIYGMIIWEDHMGGSYGRIGELNGRIKWENEMGELSGRIKWEEVGAHDEWYVH